MEENMISPAEINSVVSSLNKKRKLQTEPLEMPFPKHVCWDQRLEYDSSSDSSTDLKKVRSSIFSRGGESDPESAKDSFSFSNGDADSVMSAQDDAKTYNSYPKTRSSIEPSTSCASWDGGNSAETSLYSLESRSVTKPCSSKSGSLSISEELDSRHDDDELHPSCNYEDQLLEFGSHADCSFAEYLNHFTDKDLDYPIYSYGVPPNNHVLSSGRLSVNQDTQQGTRKPTIDKEFEEYFSMLML